MNHHTRLAWAILISLYAFGLNAQSVKCAAVQNLHKCLQKDPSLHQKMLQSEEETRAWIAKHALKKGEGSRGVVTIPTVVHVIWNDPVQNISDRQIRSQIDVLNKDFRMKNADSLARSHPFWKVTMDAGIEFCLARQDPDGNPTSGITRTKTPYAAWDDENLDYIMSTADGGRDNWDPNRYLNLYVVNLEGDLLGYSSFPDQLATDPELDGVIIRHEVFGTEGTAGSNGFEFNDRGRTCVHEVGHWLNLNHIWGDTLCGNDLVSDTEPAEDANYECPNFPHNKNNACGSGPNGEMYMNYMDYVDDDCMNMFTGGQSDRMHATLNGLRRGLLSANGCQLPSYIGEPAWVRSVSVYPNPNEGAFTLSLDPGYGGSVRAGLFDPLGAPVRDFGLISSGQSEIRVSGISGGIYYLRLSSPGGTAYKKIIVGQ